MDWPHSCFVFHFERRTKGPVFCDVTLCWPVNSYRRFEGALCLHFDWPAVYDKEDINLLRKSVTIYQSTRRNITEDLNFYQHRCENLKSWKLDQTSITVCIVYPKAPSLLISFYPLTVGEEIIVAFNHTLDRTFPKEWSIRRTVLYLTTYNTRQTSMLLAGFEPAIPASERP